MVVNLLTGLKGGIPALGGILGAGMRGFPKILRGSDFAAATVTGASGFVKLGSKTVGAQQEQAWGWGSPNTAEAGRLYIDNTTTAAADIDGMIRLAAANANETAIDVVMEIRSEMTSENSTDITKQVYFPEITNYPILGRRPREDDLLSLYFDYDTAADIWSPTASTIRIHTTLYQ